MRITGRRTKQQTQPICWSAKKEKSALSWFTSKFPFPRVTDRIVFRTTPPARGRRGIQRFFSRRVFYGLPNASRGGCSHCKKRNPSAKTIPLERRCSSLLTERIFFVRAEKDIAGMRRRRRWNRLPSVILQLRGWSRQRCPDF